MRRDLPSGTVTFLFTDVEGSTRLLHELGAEGYADALAEHRRVIRKACVAEGGVEVDTQGDAFFFAFPTAPGALAAAAAFTDTLASGPILVRVGLHTGTPLLAEEGYVGGDVHRAARIAAAGHGGQVLVSSSTAALVGTVLVDLGEHRLKDLSAPERIHQLGVADFPALDSLYRSNLPIPATPFFGRERELAEVVELLSDERSRLLTLTGPGGTGKTRLALQAAGLASGSYPDGVWWIPLASVRDAGLVGEAVGPVLGARHDLRDHIAAQRMLCLLDNFEHVVAAAPELASLLSACPNLELLVTSREPLHLSGEQEYPVRPLVDEERVGFFLARARAVSPEFRLDGAVSEICARLDGLPLALELAAARVKALSSGQILERLEQRLALLTGGARDLPERQQTLRATIEWSYDLLDDGERRLFARLSVFRGGCTLEGAEFVAGADLDTLQSLVDKSLLRHSGERYSMLETIREYAAERLDDPHEAEAVRRRHVEHFLALAEEAEPHLRGDPAAWLDRLEVEHDNLRAALDGLDLPDDGELALRFVASLSRFWAIRGYLGEGRRRLEMGIASASHASALRAHALAGLTVVAILQQDFDSAKTFAEEALSLNVALGDSDGIATSEFHLGAVAAYGGAWLAARERLKASVGRFEVLGDDHHALVARQNLAWATYECGDRARAYELHLATLERSRELSNVRITAGTLSALASHALDDDRVADALALLSECLRLHREVGDRTELTLDLCRCSRAAAAAGRGELACVLLASADRAYEELGTAGPAWAVAEREHALVGIRSLLDDAAIAECFADGREQALDEAVALALEFLDRHSTILGA